MLAATLCRIKAKILILKKPIDEEGNEIDPRQELVDRLLEYKRFKGILDEMRKLEEDRSFRSVRGNAHAELSKIANKALADVELESVSLYKLMRTFERVMQKMDDRQTKVVHRVYNYPYTIASQQDFIFSKLENGQKADFVDLFSKMENRVHAITTFLALLELLNLQKIDITQGEGINNFWIVGKEEA
ncbi:MAG: segregation/condensation protein A [Saprospiraceae bacterium]